MVQLRCFPDHQAQSKQQWRGTRFALYNLPAKSRGMRACCQLSLTKGIMQRAQQSWAAQVSWAAYLSCFLSH